MRYTHFATMVAVSTLIMFILMYFNTYALADVYFSQTRMWMALMMGAAMGMIMMIFMWSMYANKFMNFGILLICIVVFAGSLWCVRTQNTVSDTAWMKAMIPHHSIAVLTSMRSSIHDPRVRDLADRIIVTQLREIDEMKALIRDLDQHPLPRNTPTLPPLVNQSTTLPASQ